MKKKYLYLIGIAGFLVAVDQVTKLLVITRFRLHDSVVVVKGFFNITFIKNFGAAFGVMGDASPHFREWFFTIVPILAMSIVLIIFRTLKEEQGGQIVALACIFGGALGNFTDRLRFKYVVDFLDFHYKSWHWPAFNVADAAICIGVSLIILEQIIEFISAGKNKEQPEDGAN